MFFCINPLLWKSVTSNSVLLYPPNKLFFIPMQLSKSFIFIPFVNLWIIYLLEPLNTHNSIILLILSHNYSKLSLLVGVWSIYSINILDEFYLPRNIYKSIYSIIMIISHHASNLMLLGGLQVKGLINILDEFYLTRFMGKYWTWIAVEDFLTVFVDYN